MKILFYRYGSICEPDIIEAFEELGHTVTQITDLMTNKDISFTDSAKLISQSLLSQPQDCVFTINFFPTVSEVCNIFKIRYLSWIVDSPVMELFTKSIQNPCNRIFLFDREQWREIAPLNPDCVFYFPLAANVSAKQSVINNTSSILRKKFSSDISFVGSLYTEKSPYDRIKNLSPKTEGFLNGIMNAQEKIYGYYFIEELLTDEVIQEFKTCLPDYYQCPFDNFLTDKITISQLYIGNKISSMERLHMLKSLSEHFHVDLYTGSDTSSLPKIHNRGFANSLTEMPVIFNQSKINLNITSKAIRSGIPLRIFDILGCEGFMLSNYQTELMELFEPGVEFDYYTSEDELIEKSYYYLEHEKERKEIAHNGFLKVQSEYNYSKRLEELLLLAFS